MNTVFNSKWGRFLLLIPVAVAIFTGFYVGSATGVISESLLQEKIVEKHLEIDLICSQIDAFIASDADWGAYDYEKSLQNSMAIIDEQPFTFAALYTERLEDVSRRTPSYDTPFVPLDYPEFAKAIADNEQGDIVLVYAPGGDAKPRDMHVYYRWVPTDETLQGRYLLAVAVSQYSVTNKAIDWISLGNMPLIIINLISGGITVGLVAYLGDIYRSRRGPKRRERIEPT